MSPIYKWITEHPSTAKKTLCVFINSLSNETIKEFAQKQHSKGVKKYGSTLDENQSNKDWESETIEEIVDAMAYMQKLQIEKIKKYYS